MSRDRKRRRRQRKAIRRRQQRDGTSFSTARRNLGIGAAETALRDQLVAIIATRLRSVEHPLADPAATAGRLAADLMRARNAWRPRSRDDEEQRWELGVVLTDAVCDRLDGKQPAPQELMRIRAPVRGEPPQPARDDPPPPDWVNGGEVWGVAIDILEATAPLLTTAPRDGFRWMFQATVDDRLCPPCDADFEYINEDSDD